MKLCIVVGTRPEIIKMSSVIRECVSRGVDFFILHTGQHYSHNMDGIFFEELGLPSPKYNLAVGSSSFAEQLSRMLAGFERVLTEEKPDFVLAEGDTNTVLAAALVSTNLHIPFVHVEAGLRSYNRQMQEEKNRLFADAVSDILFPPTMLSFDTLLKEGKGKERVFLTGNTISDAVSHYLPIAEKKVSVEKFGVKPKQYFLATIHRAENTDELEVLQELLSSLEAIHAEHSIPIIFPIHPRTRKRIADFGLKVPSGLVLIEPVGFFEFLVLEKNARLVLTDSGGVQEESCIMHTPCVTLRKDTERPETVQVGANVLTDLTVGSIASKTREMLKKNSGWPNPFGDGNAAGKMLDILEEAGK